MYLYIFLLNIGSFTWNMFYECHAVHVLNSCPKFELKTRNRILQMQQKKQDDNWRYMSEICKEERNNLKIS